MKTMVSGLETFQIFNVTVIRITSCEGNRTTCRQNHPHESKIFNSGLNEWHREVRKERNQQAI